MPSSHGKQKQAEKHKKKRDGARRSARPAATAPSTAAILRQAALLPIGPSYITQSFEDADPNMPALVTVVVTRKAPGGIFLPAIALVDRTCLGVKNAFVAVPGAPPAVSALLARIGQAYGEPVVPCERLVAQSVVYHAIDYARSLGFEPHPDFPEPIFGPRPEVLLDTPLAHPERPIFISGPADDVPRVLARLTAAVGQDNFRYVVLASEAATRALERA